MKRPIARASGTMLASLLAAGLGQTAVAGTMTVNVDGDPVGAGTCPAACSLRQAIATAIAGDTLVFDSGLTSPIALSQGPLVIGKALTLLGPGAAKLTVSAQNASRVLEVDAEVMISAITFADGAVTGATGSDGGNGSGAGANGGNGGPGESVGGACLLIDPNATLLLDRAAVRHCVAQGGTGGTGGIGGEGDCAHYDPYNGVCDQYGFGGNGGTGGPGGAARGGAILVQGALTLTNSSVFGALAAGGTGGYGGWGGGVYAYAFVGYDGYGGTGGGADGGALFAATGASLRVANSTISGNTATGGHGGEGGFYTSLGGYGGDGGDAHGGSLSVANGVTIADVEFSTLTHGQATGGVAGDRGIHGYAYGNAIFANTTTTVLSSVVVNVQSGVSLCDGDVVAAAGSTNLSEDTSCSGFSLHANFAQTLRPLDLDATPWPGYMPVWHSPAIDVAANCKDLAAQTVASDQHGTPRPQGASCDLGAIEADYTFVNGFD